MQTHYVRHRKRAGLTNKLSTPQEGHVLGAVPGDRLITEVDLVGLTEAFCKKNGEPVLTAKAVGNLLKTLVDKGFVLEVHGSRLERIINEQ